MGRLRVHEQYRDDPLKIHKGSMDEDGYIRYSIRESGRKRNVLAHRLVAHAFIPNPSQLPEVNHKNGVRHENHVGNLEWVTTKENVNHAYEVLGRRGHNGGMNKPVNKLSIGSGEILDTFDSMREAARSIGMSGTSTISNAIRFREGICGGFRWEFVDEGVETNER